MSFEDLGPICKMRRNSTDRTKWKCLGSLTPGVARGKFIDEIPMFAHDIQAWGNDFPGQHKVRWFKTLKEAESFTIGAMCYKSYLINSLSGHYTRR
jgi:hypothetical protein